MTPEQISKLPEFVVRMADELNELDAKRDALKKFMEGESFAKLHAVAKLLMEHQAEAMEQYSKVLSLRICFYAKDAGVI
jgi:hypothetical protein